jgi:hypothetical protein
LEEAMDAVKSNIASLKKAIKIGTYFLLLYLIIWVGRLEIGNMGL